MPEARSFQPRSDSLRRRIIDTPEQEQAAGPSAETQAAIEADRIDMSSVWVDYVNEIGSEGAPSSVRETHLGSDDVQGIRAYAHDVTGMELSAAPQLRFTVDGHLTAGDEGLGLRSARGSAGKLEQLAEPDHVAGDSDRLLHTESVAGPSRREHPESSSPSRRYVLSPVRPDASNGRTHARRRGYRRGWRMAGSKGRSGR